MDKIIVIEGDPYLSVTLDGDPDVLIVGTSQPYGTYPGPYEVTPRLYSQSLDTDDQLMRDDVTVHEIPITRTSNPQGGQTVLIG